ncbi:MAG: hypothetical protein GXN98_01660 [Euryarchaeota archaeon]|nr:hypothetical protein [Euryarchaeota archaeon]
MRVLLIFLLCMPLVAGAEIYGTLYSWELEPLDNVLVWINTTPEQKVVARDGTYSFTVPPGHYVLRASYNGTLQLEAVEEVTVVEEGRYRIDLILFPVLEEDLQEDEIEAVLPGNGSGWWLLAALAAAAGAAVYLLARRRRGAKEEEQLPEDLAELLEIIRREGGRVKQSELRRIVGCSEAKLSLMLADLEHRGRIRKIRKGRGNIIVLR